MNDLTLKEATLMIKEAEDTIMCILHKLAKEIERPIEDVELTRTSISVIGNNIEEYVYKIQISVEI